MHAAYIFRELFNGLESVAEFGSFKISVKN